VFDKAKTFVSPFDELELLDEAKFLFPYKQKIDFNKNAKKM